MWKEGLPEGGRVGQGECIPQGAGDLGVKCEYEQGPDGGGGMSTGKRDWVKKGGWQGCLVVEGWWEVCTEMGFHTRMKASLPCTLAPNQ